MKLGSVLFLGIIFWLGESVVKISSIQANSPDGKSQHTSSLKIISQLPPGIYYGFGTLFNNSRREIAHNNRKSCIKIVNDPPSPYSGQENIIISTLSLNNGKIYIDALDAEIEFRADTNTVVSFYYDGGGRTAWELRNIETDPRTTPDQNKKMQECLNSQEQYIHRMTGISIPGLNYR